MLSQHVRQRLACYESRHRARFSLRCESTWSYHVKFNPPQRLGLCDRDGGELYQRDDDQPETVRERLKVYWEQTSPLIDHYREQGVLVEVDGDQPIDAVTEDLRATLVE